LRVSWKQKLSRVKIGKRGEALGASILAILCRWCSYAGADLTGSSRISYPPNIRVLRVPCSGRVDPLFILRALRSGLDGVLVSGCHPGDCHYTAGNYNARRKFAILARLLEFVASTPGGSSSPGFPPRKGINLPKW